MHSLQMKTPFGPAIMRCTALLSLPQKEQASAVTLPVRCPGPIRPRTRPPTQPRRAGCSPSATARSFRLSRRAVARRPCTIRPHPLLPSSERQCKLGSGACHEPLPPHYSGEIRPTSVRAGSQLEWRLKRLLSHGASRFVLAGSRVWSPSLSAPRALAQELDDRHARAATTEFRPMGKEWLWRGDMRGSNGWRCGAIKTHCLLKSLRTIEADRRWWYWPRP